MGCHRIDDAELSNIAAPGLVNDSVHVRILVYLYHTVHIVAWELWLGDLYIQRLCRLNVIYARPMHEVLRFEMLSELIRSTDCEYLWCLARLDAFFKPMSISKLRAAEF
jgi:hypothetical protein